MCIFYRLVVSSPWTRMFTWTETKFTCTTTFCRHIALGVSPHPYADSRWRTFDKDRTVATNVKASQLNVNSTFLCKEIAKLDTRICIFGFKGLLRCVQMYLYNILYLYKIQDNFPQCIYLQFPIPGSMHFYRLVVTLPWWRCSHELKQNSPVLLHPACTLH